MQHSAKSLWRIVPAALLLFLAAPALAGTLVRVHGHVVYERFDGMVVAVPDAHVLLQDMTSETGFYPLGSTYTDASGSFDTTFDWVPNHGHTYPNLRVNVGTGNPRIAVWNYDGDDFDSVDITTDTEWEYTGVDLDVGWLQPERESHHAVWHVFVNATRMYTWISNHIFDDLPQITIRTNHGNSHMWFLDYSGEYIDIGTDHLWREPSIARAYAKYWLGYHESEGLIGLDYCNSTCDPGSLPYCFHCDWCNEDEQVAWVEGFCAFAADKFCADYEDTYGYAPLYTVNYDDLQQCGDGTYHDPEITEGYFAALLHDIDDTGEDNHPQYPLYRDRVALGYSTVFAVMRDAENFSPLDFLKDIVILHPSWRYQLWETGMNCGYDCDEDPPGVVTDLTSPSQPLGSPSSDSTPEFTWTHAYDDASGISGYYVDILAAPGPPTGTQFISSTTSVTMGPLAPGTYYFSIQARDRAGHLATSYATYGPFTILPPLPADLVFHSDPDWDYPLIPSSQANNTSFEAHVSATLTGNSTSTYWNLLGWNVGETIADWSFRCYVHVDGVPTAYAIWSGIGPDEGFYTANEGPIFVPGGRHCWTGMIDELDDIPEVDETNNIWGREFVWTGRGLSTGIGVTRAAPPGHMDGWDEVTSGSLWYVCDGLNFTNTGRWTAVALWADDPLEDYDCRLHVASTGAQNGFASNIGTSTRPEGWLDAVLVNRNTMGQQSFDVGVLNRYEGVEDYHAIKMASELRAFGDSLTVILSANQFLRLLEFEITADDTGPVSMVADIDPEQGPVHIAWFSSDFTTGGLDDATEEAVTDAAGRARIDVDIAGTGYNCLAVFRNPADGTGSISVTVEIGPTPPDLLPYASSGWHSPLVPRPAPDGTGTAVALPDTLYGNAAATYVNICTRNAGPVASPGSWARARLDGAAWINLHYNTLAAATSYYYNSGLGRTVRGGRHTLDVFEDADAEVEEMHEDNNIYGEQYVWGPLAVPHGTTVSRNQPPPATGGWDRITSGEARWYNCDGLRMPLASAWWGAVAVMPAAGTDVDLRSHDAAEGAKNGFRVNHGLSTWGPGESDFVLVNFNMTAFAPYDIGVLDFGQGGSYTAESAGSTYLGSAAGTYGPFTLAAGHILHLLEFRLGTGFYTLRLENVAGDVDWGLSVYPAGDPWLVKSEAIDGGISWLGGPGEDEYLTFEITEQDYYGVAVWKRGSADLPLAGQYDLVLRTGFTDVPPGEGPPAATRLVGVYPNPFNPRTTVAFELAQQRDVRLAVYDLTGTRIRWLLQESRPAGRHEVVWDGLDGNGRRVASGVYVLRLEAGTIRDLRKVVLLK